MGIDMVSFTKELPKQVVVQERTISCDAKQNKELGMPSSKRNQRGELANKGRQCRNDASGSPNVRRSV